MRVSQPDSMPICFSKNLAVTMIDYNGCIECGESKNVGREESLSLSPVTTFLRMVLTLVRLIKLDLFPLYITGLTLSWKTIQPFVRAKSSSYFTKMALCILAKSYCTLSSSEFYDGLHTAS
jgi:hypothetical protein